jgi:hypothetical protein
MGWDMWLETGALAMSKEQRGERFGEVRKANRK